MFRNIIFDWSGTLVDDLSLVLDATNNVFTHYGLTPLDKAGFRAQFHLPYPDFYKKVLPHIPLTELENVFREGFRISTQKVHLLPYAQQFMEYCQDRRIRCFALTSVDKHDFERQVTELGMKPYFEHIYSGVLNKKEVILDLIRTHSLNKDETAFIGDMTHDVETANYAGITSIAVLTGYQNATQLSQATPDIITPNLEILHALLDKRALREAQERANKREADSIKLKKLELPCHIGVPEEERVEKQLLWADITLIPKAPLTHLDDNIQATIDYAEVAYALRQLASDHPRKLIETLAEDLLNFLLQNYPLAQARVKIYKKILPETEYVSIKLTRNGL